jgi:inorganic triphosphatase YgiF
MNIETECKLIAPDASALRGLREALTEVCEEVRSMGRQLIEDAYLDTEDWRLFRAGYACRIRRISGRTVLALKSLKRPLNMVSVREELEEELPAPPRSLHKIPGKRVGKRIRAMARGGRLRRLFRLRNRRETYEVKFGKGLLAHVSADKFTLFAAGRKRRLAEVEIEVRRGGQVELRALARLLVRRMGLSPRHRAKFQEGLTLAGLTPGMMWGRGSRDVGGRSSLYT